MEISLLTYLTERLAAAQFPAVTALALADTLPPAVKCAAWSNAKAAVFGTAPTSSNECTISNILVISSRYNLAGGADSRVTSVSGVLDHVRFFF